MNKLLVILSLITLTGCSSVPTPQRKVSSEENFPSVESFDYFDDAKGSWLPYGYELVGTDETGKACFLKIYSINFEHKRDAANPNIRLATNALIPDVDTSFFISNAREPFLGLHGVTQNEKMKNITQELSVSMDLASGLPTEYRYIASKNPKTRTVTWLESLPSKGNEAKASDRIIKVFACKDLKVQSKCSNWGTDTRSVGLVNQMPECHSN